MSMISKIDFDKVSKELEHYKERCEILTNQIFDIIENPKKYGLKLIKKKRQNDKSS